MYLLFDIGATNIRLAVSRDSKTFGKPRIIPTPSDFDKGIASFKKTFKELTKRVKVKAAAGGMPGSLDAKKEVILQSRNMPGWIEEPLKKELMRIVGAEVFLENDSDMVGLGEAVIGAGKGFNVVAYITVSTGVGGVRIVNRKIDVSTHGFEPGYQAIDVDGSIAQNFLSTESRYGNKVAYLQRLVSGKDIEMRFGKKPDDIKDEKIWDEITKFLAYGLNNTIVHWSPDIVVLGGGMIKSPRFSVDNVNKYLKEILIIFPELPEVKKAKLGDFGGLYGALAYLKQIKR